MNGLDLLTDAVFLPLSFHASLSDIRKRVLPSNMEFMLLSCGIVMILTRALYFGIDDPFAIAVNNAIPLALLLISSILGKTGFGDFEYALSMALSYPSLCEATSFTILQGIFEPLRISASTISIALMNAIMISWLIVFSMGVSKWCKERKYPGKFVLLTTLATMVPIPRTLLLTPLLSKLIYQREPPIIELPLIPLIFLGFVMAHFAQAILL